MHILIYIFFPLAYKFSLSHLKVLSSWDLTYLFLYHSHFSKFSFRITINYCEAFLLIFSIEFHLGNARSHRGPNMLCTSRLIYLGNVMLCQKFYMRHEYVLIWSLGMWQLHKLTQWYFSLLSVSSCMFNKVHSDWLLSYTKAAWQVHLIFGITACRGWISSKLS